MLWFFEKLFKKNYLKISWQKLGYLYPIFSLNLVKS